MTVPATVTDPIWSLQPWPVSVTFAGLLVEVPALPAVEWLSVLMDPEGSFLDMFPGFLEPEEESRVLEAMFETGVDMERYHEVMLSIISQVSGRPWWVAMRLVETARVSWHTLGAMMLLKGVDATRLSLSAWLDAVLLTIMNNIDSKDAAMFSLRLQAPPPGSESEAPEPEISAQQFLAMA